MERLDLAGLEPPVVVRVSLDRNEGLCIMATHLGLRRRDRRLQLDSLQHAVQNGRHSVLACEGRGPCCGEQKLTVT